MGFLLSMLLCLLLFPFLLGILALVLLAFRHDLSLLEQGDGWPHPFIEIFLVDFNPIGIAGLFAYLNPFKDVLLIRFERRQVIRCEHIGRTMKTRQLGKLTDQFWGLDTIANRQFRIGSIVAYPLWIECLWLMKNRQHLFAWYILRFS